MQLSGLLLSGCAPPPVFPGVRSEAPGGLLPLPGSESGCFPAPFFSDSPGIVVTIAEKCPGDVSHVTAGAGIADPAGDSEGSWRGVTASLPLLPGPCHGPRAPILQTRVGPSVLPWPPPGSAPHMALGGPDPALSPTLPGSVGGSLGDAREQGQRPGGWGGPQMGQAAHRWNSSTVPMGRGHLVLGLLPPRGLPRGSLSLPLLSS